MVQRAYCDNASRVVHEKAHNKLKRDVSIL